MQYYLSMKNKPKAVIIVAAGRKNRLFFLSNKSGGAYINMRLKIADYRGNV